MGEQKEGNCREFGPKGLVREAHFEHPVVVHVSRCGAGEQAGIAAT